MKHIFVLFFMSLILMQSAYSVEFKKSSGLVINSKESIVDFKKGVNVYKGDVVITTIDFELIADKVIEFKENGVTIKAEVFGNPVKFKRFDKAKNIIMFGDAKKTFYYRKEDKVVLFDYSLTNINGDRMIGQKGDFILETLLTSQ